MKALLFFVLFTSCILLAQEAEPDSAHQFESSQIVQSESRTMLEEPIHHGVYGAGLLKFGQVGSHGDNSLLVGGEVAWTMNKKYYLGLGFYGLSTVVKAPHIFPVEGLLLLTNYGGLLLG